VFGSAEEYEIREGSERKNGRRRRGAAWREKDD